ncbi:transposase [Thiolapillus sp.]
MPKPRKALISLDDTPYYHCVSRCVRRTFLCGDDPVTGKSFEHRCEWVESRLLELAGVFSIDVCAYAVMSNHTHVVLHVDRDKAQAWSLREVVERWHRLFAGTLISQAFLSGKSLHEAQRAELAQQAEVWRERLTSISWFMRCLNEAIARQANAEDGCTGRFWEGRFKSQALLDEAALLACMAYVDLNPVRAKLATTPESSKYTSVRKRVLAALHKQTQPVELLPFVGNHRQDSPKGLSFSLEDYLELMDWTGRAIREDKAGYIDAAQLPILQRLGLEGRSWQELTRSFERLFHSLVGRPDRMEVVVETRAQRWVQGIGNCRRYFSPG